MLRLPHPLFVLAVLASSVAQTESVIIPARVCDSVTLSALDSMKMIADTANSLYQVQIFKHSAVADIDEPSTALFIALTRLGERVDREVYRIRTLTAPRVERIELGHLAFKMTVAYDVDLSARRLSASVTLDRLMGREP